MTENSQMTDFGEDQPRAEITGDMIMSPTIGKLALALAKAQGAIVPPRKDKHVKVTPKDSNKRSYEFDYATLDSVMDAIRKPLSDNGLAIVQLLIPIDKKHKLRTLLIHESGEFIGSEAPILIGQDVTNQGFGSALTYMRRYTIVSLLGITADEDDDANAADGNQAETTQRPQSTKPVSEARGGGKTQQPAAKPPAATVAAAGGAGAAPTKAPEPVKGGAVPSKPPGSPPVSKPVVVQAPAAAPAPEAEGAEPVKYPGPFERGTDEYRAAIAEWTRIKNHASAAQSSDELAAILGTEAENLDRISAVHEDAKKAVAQLLENINKKMQELPAGDGFAGS